MLIFKQNFFNIYNFPSKSLHSPDAALIHLFTAISRLYLLTRMDLVPSDLGNEEENLVRSLGHFYSSYIIYKEKHSNACHSSILKMVRC